MNGSSKWTSVQQGGWVSGLCADASNQVDSSSAAVVTDLPIQQSDDQQATAHSEAVDVAASTPHCCSALHTTDRSQQGACTVPEQAADAPADAKQSTRTLQLTFHKGLYHNVMRQSNCGASVADLVFGANAGTLITLTWACKYNCPHYCGYHMKVSCQIPVHMVLGHKLFPNRLVLLWAILSRLCHTVFAWFVCSNDAPSSSHLFTCRPCCICLLGANSAAAQP